MTTLFNNGLIEIQMNGSNEVFITELPSGVTIHVSTDYERGLTVTAHGHTMMPTDIRLFYENDLRRLDAFKVRFGRFNGE